jgi:hypothetical protein
MPKGKTTIPHTSEVRAQALKIYSQQGAGAAARLTGVPRSTISRWVQIHKVKPFDRTSMAELQDMADMSRKARRDRLAERLLIVAETEIDRLRQPYTEYRTPAGAREPLQVKLREPTPSDRKSIMTVAAIAIDKAQLLSGEATSRNEHVSIKEIEEALGEVITSPADRKRVALTVLKGRTRSVGSAGAGKPE